MVQANGMFMLQGTNMREVIKYYNDTLEKDETKIYYLDKKVSTQDTLFLYYKSIEKTKDCLTTPNGISVIINSLWSFSSFLLTLLASSIFPFPVA